jgi:hypothetical protein
MLDSNTDPDYLHRQWQRSPETEAADFVDVQPAIQKVIASPHEKATPILLTL